MPTALIVETPIWLIKNRQRCTSEKRATENPSVTLLNNSHLWLGNVKTASLCSEWHVIQNWGF